MKKVYNLEVERLIKDKALFDKCFTWATNSFPHIANKDLLVIISGAISDDSDGSIKDIQKDIEYRMKTSFTKYACETGGDKEWEWISNKKTKRTSDSYLDAALYTRFEKGQKGNQYDINSITDVEEFYDPNIAEDIYQQLKKENKEDIKGFSKKKLISAIKMAVDFNINQCESVPELVRLVVCDVYKFLIEFDSEGQEEIRLAITEEVQDQFGDVVWNDSYDDETNSWQFELDLGDDHQEDVTKFIKGWNERKPEHLTCKQVDSETGVGISLLFINHFKR